MYDVPHRVTLCIMMSHIKQWWSNPSVLLNIASLSFSFCMHLICTLTTCHSFYPHFHHCRLKTLYGLCYLFVIQRHKIKFYFLLLTYLYMPNGWILTVIEYIRYIFRTCCTYVQTAFIVWLKMVLPHLDLIEIWSF